MRYVSARFIFSFVAAAGILIGLNPTFILAFQKSSIFTASSDLGKTQIPDTPGVVGGDGDFTVTAPNTILNNYTTLAVDAATTDTSFTVANIADLNSSIPQLGPIAVGDLLLIIQMQGASIDTTDTVNYGSVTTLNSAGLYEFVTIGSIAGNTITINGETCITDLRNDYSTSGRTQVIRVPQFRDLIVDPGASVVPAIWSGSSGGVVALQISRFFTLNGSIDASAQGFRGGQLETSSNFPGTFVGYRTNSVADGAEKGEGIAGYQTDYDALSGRYGRGAPANGGGGGQAHNTGGGGGANGNNGNAWTGQGVMPPTPLAAWQLDPGFFANGGLTNSSGGGRAGYSYSEFNQDATVAGPGNALWGGDFRKELGGLGGRPLTNNPASRLFLGGGGGSGDASNINGGAGGRGGGLVLVQAGSLTGSGSIFANGENGFNTQNSHTDGAGGGGGGGTVVVSSFALTGVSLTANGGNGGNQLIVGDEAEGPGGAGGGGFIAVRVGTPTRTATGGLGGSTTSSAMTEFSRNGATDGATGQSTAAVALVNGLPICVAPSSAPVEILGRVVTESGMGIPRAYLEFTDSQGNSINAMTNPFGYFRFISVPAGQVGILSVRHKRYTFSDPTRVIVPVESVTQVTFTAEPE